MEYTGLFLFGMGLLGMLLHTFVKLDSLNKQSEGNINFKKFLKMERFALILSLLFVIGSAILSQEVKELANAGKWLGIGHVALGYFAQSITVKLGSIGKKRIDNFGK